MTKGDYESFSEILTTLAEAFNEALSAGRLMLYFGALDDCSLDEVRSAAMRAAKTCRFFPKPVELRDLIHGSPDDRTLAAWTRVDTALREVGTHQSVTFDDPILHATIVQMGGWYAAWEWERLDERDYGFKRLEFTRFYKLFLERGAPSSPKYLMGQAEITNRENAGGWKRGLAEHVDEILQIDAGGKSIGPNGLGNILPAPVRQQLQGRTAPHALPPAGDVA